MSCGPRPSSAPPTDPHASRSFRAFKRPFVATASDIRAPSSFLPTRPSFSVYLDSPNKCQYKYLISFGLETEIDSLMAHMSSTFEESAIRSVSRSPSMADGELVACWTASFVNSNRDGQDRSFQPNMPAQKRPSLTLATANDNTWWTLRLPQGPPQYRSCQRRPAVLAVSP